ncbi:MAG TPA: UDP-N-acetylmuramate--L-alanine ligase [Clostridiales bacterium]|nr:UDP-N-acetylmuramate--L-alanine ligase [Clostridiales bacterium]
MYKIDFNKPCRVFFIGIGGISMSGFAEYLHINGFQVSGSDNSKNYITEHLNRIDIKVHLGQRASNISNDIDLIVYTAAIKEDNEEFIEAKRRSIPMLNRAELIGQIMLRFDNAIAISGTHGKTTSTSMISMILLEAKLDPTISVGGILDAINGNLRIGNSKHFVTEACEYTNSFLHFNPNRAVILNIGEDHLDFFKDLNDIRNSFNLFVKKIPQDGQLFINGKIDNYEEILNGAVCEVFTFGIHDDENQNSFDYSARNIVFDSLDNGCFDLYYKNTFIDNIKLNIIGLHNIENALPAIAMALQMGIEVEIIKNAMLAYNGTKRRFEKKGMINGITIIDDYAHHPVEIKATLSAAKLYEHKNDIWCVFQPHTFSRTKQHLKEFAKSLSLADKIILADIFPAREKDPGDISSKDLARELELLDKEVYYLSSFDEIEIFLLQHCINGDLLITMGAGDIVKVGEGLLGL